MRCRFPVERASSAAGRAAPGFPRSGRRGSRRFPAEVETLATWKRGSFGKSPTDPPLFEGGDKTAKTPPPQTVEGAGKPLPPARVSAATPRTGARFSGLARARGGKGFRLAGHRGVSSPAVSRIPRRRRRHVPFPIRTRLALAPVGPGDVALGRLSHRRGLLPGRTRSVFPVGRGRRHRQNPEVRTTRAALSPESFQGMRRSMHRVQTKIRDLTDVRRYHLA